MANQTPEQKARDLIDKKLVEAGWAVQSKDGIDLNVARDVAIREYTSDTGPMDYMLMVDGKPCAARPDRATRLPDQGDHQARGIVRPGAAPRTRADGDRFGQDL